MQYVLVKDRQFILLGPIEWRARFIQSELNDLGINYTVSSSEPNGYLNVSGDVEIFPASIVAPNHDPMYEQLSGPFWSFDNNTAIGTYHAIDKDLEIVKGDLRKIAAAERYKKEVAGTKVTIGGTEVTVDTSRDGRIIYNQQLATMTSSTLEWKFPEGWLTLTKTDVETVIMTINNHVQQQFAWEKSIGESIDAATGKAGLQAITIVEPDPRAQGGI